MNSQKFKEAIELHQNAISDLKDSIRAADGAIKQHIKVLNALQDACEHEWLRDEYDPIEGKCTEICEICGKVRK